MTGKRQLTDLAKQFDDWTQNATCDFDTAVTLTFRNDPETIERAQKQLSHFLNKLNDACYGNNWSRRAKHSPSARLAVVPIIENGYGRKRLHYHCVFSCPSNMSNEKFHMLIEFCWNQTRDGGDTNNDVQRIYDGLGFAGYMTKELRDNDCDKLDVMNAHIY